MKRRYLSIHDLDTSNMIIYDLSVRTRCHQLYFTVYALWQCFMVVYHSLFYIPDLDCVACHNIMDWIDLKRYIAFLAVSSY